MGDLLVSLINQSSREIDATGVVHRTAIGDMYEGLSRNLLEASIPEFLDVRVVEGFVTDEDGNQSGQIDCMVVFGDGQKLPHSDAWIFPISQLVAAIEVKKTLNSKILGEAVEHLERVRDLPGFWTPLASGDPGYIDDIHGSGKRIWRSVCRSFGQITGVAITEWADRGSLTPADQMILASLLNEHYMPLRAIHGFGGFTTEYGLRKAVTKYAKGRVDSAGVLPSLPQLITCGHASVVMANGQPFAAVATGKDAGAWLMYCSLPRHSMRLLLELVWTRLDLLFGLGNPWGDDRVIENLRPLIVVSPSEQGGESHLEASFIKMTNKKLSEQDVESAWAPEILTPPQAVVLALMASKGIRARSTDGWVVEAARDAGTQDVAAFLESLVATNLVAWLADRSGIEVIEDDLGLAVDPDLGFVAAGNGTGRLSRWTHDRLRQGRQLRGNELHD